MSSSYEPTVNPRRRVHRGKRWTSVQIKRALGHRPDDDFDGGKHRNGRVVAITLPRVRWMERPDPWRWIVGH